MSVEVARPLRVTSDTIIGVMLPAISFNREIVLGAVEVQDLRAELVLAAELGAGELAIAQMVPEAALGVGGVAAELAVETRPRSSASIPSVASWHASPHPSPLTLVPSTLVDA